MRRWPASSWPRKPGSRRRCAPTTSRSRAQGHSGFAWSWLGAALQATGLPFGCVNAPGQRYHPAIVAQAAATLAEMFPGRFWVALGSGEALNEHITGARWPAKQARNDRLLECVEVIRALFAGETVSHRGLVTVDRAKLWSRPVVPPSLLGAAVSPETAGWVAGWADGLITVNQPVERLRRVVDAFRAGGAGKPMYLQVHLAYARDEATALANAHQQWGSNVLDGLAGDGAARAVRGGDQRPARRRPRDGAGLGRPVAPHRVAGRPRRARLRRRLRARGGPRPAPHHRAVRHRGAARAGRGHAGTAHREGAVVSDKATSDLWWKNAVIYCLDVELFADGDGDGVGDFPGLTDGSTTWPGSG